MNRYFFFLFLATQTVCFAMEQVEEQKVQRLVKIIKDSSITLQGQAEFIAKTRKNVTKAEEVFMNNRPSGGYNQYHNSIHKFSLLFNFAVSAYYQDLSMQQSNVTMQSPQMRNSPQASRTPHVYATSFPGPDYYE